MVGPPGCTCKSVVLRRLPETLDDARIDFDREKNALSDLVQALVSRTDRDRISVHDLLQALGDRALGALIFLFAFPNVLPMPPGTSFILGAPLVFLAGQLMLAKPPWLPNVIGKRSIAQHDFAAQAAPADADE